MKSWTFPLFALLLALAASAVFAAERSPPRPVERVAVVPDQDQEA